MCSLPEAAPLGPLEDAQELIRCMMLSEEDDVGQPASKVGADTVKSGPNVVNFPNNMW